MATVHIRSLAVAPEATFASISAATGQPTPSGLSWAVLEDDRSTITFDGQEHESNEQNSGRASAYNRPPEPVTMWASGNRLRRRTGTLTVRAPLRTIGAASTYANYAAMPLYRLLASGMGGLTPGASSDPVFAASATARNTRWSPTSLLDFEVGAGVKVDLAGRSEFSFVSNVVGGVPDLVYVSPGFSADLSSETVRLCQTLYAALGTTTLGPSVAIRADGDGWRFYGYGGRMESWSLELENRCAYLSITLRFALFVDDHSAASVEDPTEADGAIAHLLGSYCTITGVHARRGTESLADGATTPAELAAVTYDVDAFTFEYRNTLAAKSRSSNLAGISDFEVVDVQASASITLTDPTDTFNDDFLYQRERSYLIGFGPVGAGNGAAIYIPAGHVTSDPSIRTMSGDLVQQVLQVRQGKWAKDNGSDAPANTHVRLALAL